MGCPVLRSIGLVKQLLVPCDVNNNPRTRFDVLFTAPVLTALNRPGRR